MTGDPAPNEPFWRVQYQLLLTALYQESNRVWTRFQVSLAVNGGLIAVLFAILNLRRVPATELIYSLDFWSPLIISTIGVVLSILWLILTYNGFKWQYYWADRGKELEVGNPEIRVKIFSDLKLYGRAYPIGKITYGIPIVFIIGWMALFALSIYNVYVKLFN